MKSLLTTLLTVSLLTITSFQVNAQTQSSHLKSQKIIKNGTQASIKGSDKFFTGDVRIDPLFPSATPGRASGAYVTFEPGAHSAWHTHPLGQTLIVTSGVGYTQEWGGPIVEIHPGDVIICPPGVKHWHGASKQNAMTHISVAEELDGKNVEWMEKVTDAQYQGKQ